MRLPSRYGSLIGPVALLIPKFVCQIEGVKCVNDPSLDQSNIHVIPVAKITDLNGIEADRFT